MGMSTAPDAVGVAPPAAHACSASRISLIVAVVAFVTTLDNTIIAAVAPSIGRELGLELSTLQWVSVAYMLPYGGLLLGVLPGQPGVSWQGHLFGAVGGVLAALWLSDPRRPRRRDPALDAPLDGPRW